MGKERNGEIERGGTYGILMTLLVDLLLCDNEAVRLDGGLDLYESCVFRLL